MEKILDTSNILPFKCSFDNPTQTMYLCNHFNSYAVPSPQNTCTRISTVANRQPLKKLMEVTVFEKKNLFVVHYTVRVNQIKQQCYLCITNGSPRLNSADFVPTSYLVCIKEVAIRITFSQMINMAASL